MSIFYNDNHYTTNVFTQPLHLEQELTQDQFLKPSKVGWNSDFFSSPRLIALPKPKKQSYQIFTHSWGGEGDINAFSKRHSRKVSEKKLRLRFELVSLVSFSTEITLENLGEPLFSAEITLEQELKNIEISKII